jgi:lysophospholipase L1-like esterase
MPRPTLLALAALLSTAATLFAQKAPLKEGDLVGIYGDSITEGMKYSVYLEEYLLMCQPVPRLETVQFGWSGERAVGVLPRMEKENLPFGVSVATTCYGMNDGFYKPIEEFTKTEYRRGMTGIVDKLKATGTRTIVVGSPGVVDTATFKKAVGADGYNATLGELAKIASEIATEKGAIYADVHGVMMEAMKAAKAKYGPDFPVAGTDGVHPGGNGHLAMAYAFLKALGCTGEIGTITWDAKAGEAQATEGHKVLSAAPATLEIESSRYPFCFFGDVDSHDSTKNMEQFIPFNADLNRFILVIRNAPPEGATLTWGTASKDFTAEQLKNGINLADEFLDNPFSEPFKKVEAVIRNQQNYEKVAVKTLLHGLSDWKTWIPDADLDEEGLTKKVVARDAELRKASVAAVVPVKHTLTLAPVGAKTPAEATSKPTMTP